MMPLAGQFMLVVLGIATVTAAAMVPRANEWLAVMRDDRKQAQIIAQLEPRLAQDGQDPNLLATLARAYADLGDAPRATALLERYVALRPGDADAYGRLAGLYGTVGEAARQRDALERSVELAPKLPRIAELAALYRSLGKVDEERALLTAFEPDLTVRSGLLLRLAQLYVDKGETLRAVTVLSRADVIQAVPKGVRNDEERLLLATLLAETGQGAEAVRFGKVWIAQWRLPWLSNRLLMAVAKRAPDPDAFALSVQCERNYPFTRIPSDLDVELPTGTGDAAYLEALAATLALARERFGTPDLVLYLAGADPWEGDALGRLALTKTGLRARDALVLDHALGLGAPVTVTLAGGYPPVTEDGVEINAATLAEAQARVLPG